MSYDDAMRIVLPEEGGEVLSTIPGDSGGQTYAGISRNNFPDWAGWELLDRGERNTPELTNLVNYFYRKEFWNVLQCDQLPDRIAILVFDFAVNAGTGTAARALQTAAMVNPDGAIGAITIAAVRRQDQEKLIRLVIAEQLSHYVQCHGWIKFGAGWVNRVIDELRKI